MAIYVSADRLSGAAGSGGLEPQRQHNWSIIISNIGGADDQDTIALSLSTGFLPRVMNEELTVPFGNEYVYYAGKAAHDGGTIVVNDWLDRNTAQAVYNWRLQVYNPNNGRIGLASEYKKHAYIELFGPNSTDNHPQARRVWLLKGLWPIAVNFGANGLDMGSSGQVKIEMNMRYDKAVAETGFSSPVSSFQ